MVETTDKPIYATSAAAASSKYSHPAKPLTLYVLTYMKCKSLTIENVAMQLIEVSKDHSFGEKKFKINGSSLIVNLVKLENSEVFDGFSTQNAQVGSELLHKDNGTTPKREARFLRQKNKGVQSDPVPCVKEDGIGKTTLAKNVYNHRTIMKHFSLRAWVSIGQEFDEDTLLVDVGNQVLRSHESLKEQNGKEYWIKKINESLKGKRYLLILGSNVKESESVDVQELSAVLEQINQFQTPWSESFANQELAEHLKEFLSYFKLFPRNFDIPVRRLITLFVAEGLVQECLDKKETPERVAENYLSDLIDLNSIQVSEKTIDGRVKTCCLPSALREHNFCRSTSTNNRIADYFDN
uniref:NB-ARC domain-containing protein n=1 Tax=Quercus lobata TaxID=97700 RepID=A0A7N2LPI4_QUELO